MATPTELHEVLLAPMQRLYSTPYNCDDEQAALAEYASLCVFSKADLAALWEEVKRQYTNQSWPKPGVFWKVAKETRLAAERKKEINPERYLRGVELQYHRESEFDKLLHHMPELERWLHDDILHLVAQHFIATGGWPNGAQEEAMRDRQRKTAEWYDEKISRGTAREAWQCQVVLDGHTQKMDMIRLRKAPYFDFPWWCKVNGVRRRFPEPPEMTSKKIGADAETVTAAQCNQPYEEAFDGSETESGGDQEAEAPAEDIIGDYLEGRGEWIDPIIAP